MEDRQRMRVSKFLSYHLRHAPEELGLSLAPGGWVGIDELLLAAGKHGTRLTRDDLDEVVLRCDKQRFAFDEDGVRIRANQGHSTEVDLQLEPTAPPALLYHGTGANSVTDILRDGLARMARHHVHLSADVPTARKVGSRHGRPVILVVDAAGMHAAGDLFFRSANGVWLVDRVEPRWLSVLNADAERP